MSVSSGIIISRTAAVPEERYSYCLVTVGGMAVMVVYAGRVIVRTAIVYDTAGVQAVLSAYSDIVRVDHAPDELHLQLSEYLSGRKTEFFCTVRVSGSNFMVEVIKSLLQVPYGQRVTYGQLAAYAGCPGAARAVGTVMRKNTCPIIIPCHRVLSAGGGVGHYSAGEGSDTKRFLLALESRAGL
ncbi:MAG: MGMT family protein [Sedimentisphaerales bacterium]|nr:MGMT family protein [Sedimentisphaerales bacterium]MBN2842094.1 MGMT family protein [Sedimentisphaerales bacterium]